MQSSTKFYLITASIFAVFLISLGIRIYGLWTTNWRTFVMENNPLDWIIGITTAALLYFIIHKIIK